MSDNAIGHADYFGVVTATGIEDVQYDLKQVQDDGYAKFEYDGDTYETEELGLGANIPVAIAEHVIEETEFDVYGFVVEDYQLATFITRFPDREVFRNH